MTSHQNQPSLNSLSGRILLKRSNSNFETFKPPLKVWRTVGGIDESPHHPKFTQHPEHTPPPITLNTATQLLNSRLFNRTRSQHHSPNPPAESRKIIIARNPSNPLPFTRTHKSNISDSTAVSSYYPHQPLNWSDIPNHNHPEIPLTVDQTSIHHLKKSSPSSHSVVASLGLAPISNSIPSRHPFILRPLRNSNNASINSTYAFPNPCPSVRDTSTSLPQFSPIPSLLNPARAGSLAIDQPQSKFHSMREDEPTSDYTKFTHHSSHDSPKVSLEITASDQPLMSNHSYPAQPRTHSPHLQPIHPCHSSSEPWPKFESPDVAGMSDPAASVHIQPLLPPLNTHPRERSQTTHPDEQILFFEPAGKDFIKYAFPKPQLNAKKLGQGQILTGHSRDRTRNRSNTNKMHPVHHSISASKHLCKMSSDSSLEELRDRYWNSQNHNYDVNQAWAEMYIFKLERKIWKSEAEADVSVDCFNFCTSLSCNNKSKKSHRRSRSVPNLKRPLKPTPTFEVDSRGNKIHFDGTTPQLPRSKFDHSPIRKPFPIGKRLSHLMTSCPSTPFHITNAFPYINLKPAPTVSLTNSNVPPPTSITRHRANSAPRPSTNPQGTRRDPTSNYPKVFPEPGYRIFKQNAPNAQNRYAKKLARRSRSVPNLHHKRLRGLDSPHDLTETSQSFYSLDRPPSPVDPNRSSNLKIPQSLLDAMFPSVLESKEKLASSSPEKQPYAQPQTRDLIQTSEYATTDPDSPPEITQATEPAPKGPLHSLPRFIEPRSNVIIALPPPPRKRTVTPVTSTGSLNGTSVPGTNRSTIQCAPSHSSWGTPSQKTHSKSISPSSSKINRRFSAALSMRNHFPKSTSDQAVTSPIAIPRLSDSVLDSRHPSRPRSLSYAHETSPSIESRVDSVKRLSGFASASSSRRCSLDLHSAMIDDEYGIGSLPTPRLGPTRVTSKVDHVPVQNADHSTDIRQPQFQSYDDSVAFNRCSFLSSPSESCHSVIDPDIYIDQADLFYQMPASPQRDLIEDYDNRMFESMQTLNNSPLPALQSPTYDEPSELIDHILKSYNGVPGRKKSLVRNQSYDEKTYQIANKDVLKMRNNHQAASNSPKPDCHSCPTVSSQTGRGSSALHRIPEIVDAFEARLSGSLQGGESPKKKAK